MLNTEDTLLLVTEALIIAQYTKKQFSSAAYILDCSNTRIKGRVIALIELLTVLLEYYDLLVLKNFCIP